MNTFYKIYHFLGGVYFALFLIATVAIFVIFGTFIESVTNSHAYAALFTYNSPIFSFLLWGFFINILFAATRRYPFRLSHIPFLTTHLGLLMILAGVLCKHYLGVQGTLRIQEGSGSHYFFEPETLSISVLEKNNPQPLYYPLKKNFSGSYEPLIVDRADSLTLRLLEWHPHSSEKLQTWIKGKTLLINGFTPLKLGSENSISTRKIKFYEGESPSWDLVAFHSEDVEKSIRSLYEKNAHIIISTRKNKEILIDTPLEDLLNSNPELKLITDFSPSTGLVNATLHYQISGKDVIKVPLQGDLSLKNINLLNGYLGDFPLAIDIKRQPVLAFIEDKDLNVYWVAFNEYGEIFSKAYLASALDSLYSSHNGFEGYFVRAELPFNRSPASREVIEEALSFNLLQNIKQELTEAKELLPPLQILKDACKKTGVDFSLTLMTFLTHWNNASCWIYKDTDPLPDSLAQVFNHIDWTQVKKEEREGAYWTKLLFENLDPLLQMGMSPIEALKESQWPLISLFNPNEVLSDEMILTLLTQQMFSLSSSLVDSHKLSIENSISQEMSAALLSAYFRAYSIDLNHMIETPSKEELSKQISTYRSEKLHISIEDQSEQPIVLETSVLPLHTLEKSGNKLEDNTPKILLYASKGNLAQTVSLFFDKSNTLLKWPILKGAYALKFQPHYQEIPYHIRLRQARQINYPNSMQSYSYEADLIITNRKTNQEIEKTISMNHVYETSDGYRFYLSQISSSHPDESKFVHIIVNRDPAKYILTLPGALILTLGIILLFVYLSKRGKSS